MSATPLPTVTCRPTGPDPRAQVYLTLCLIRDGVPAVLQSHGGGSRLRHLAAQAQAALALARETDPETAGRIAGDLIVVNLTLAAILASFAAESAAGRLHDPLSLCVGQDALWRAVSGRLARAIETAGTAWTEEP